MNKRLIFIRAALIITGVICAAIGIYRGEALEIMQKAVIVCMECIGIG